MSISEFHQLNPNIVQFLPSNPTGTTSATVVMMGLGATVTFTPKQTGKLKFYFTGNASNSTINDATGISFYYGTGTAPINGAASTGTQINAGTEINAGATPANSIFPWAFIAYKTGFTVGTTYWIDMGVRAITGGTAGAVSIAMIIEEIPL